MQNLELFEWQKKVFANKLSDPRPARFKAIHKGRRLGSTHGQMLYCFLNMIEDNEGKVIGKLRENTSILWVDATYPNIKGYQEKFFIPFLKNNKIPYKVDNYSSRIKFGRNSEIHFRSATRPETMEGFAYDIAVCNEAGIIFNDQDAKLWYTSIMPMLLDNPNSEAIIAGTPKGKNGFQTLVNSGMFKVHQFSSYENPKIDVAWLDKMNSNLSSQFARQEIYGEFIDFSGGMIKNIEYFNPDEILFSHMDRTILGVDLAISTNTAGDYTALAAVGKHLDNYYIFDIELHKIDSDHNKLIESYYRRFPANEIAIEQVAFQKLVVTDLIKNTNLPVIGRNVHKDKVTRFLPAANKIDLGKMKFSETIKKEIISQIMDFPNPKVKDDAVDAISITLPSFDAQDDIGFMIF